MTTLYKAPFHKYWEFAHHPKSKLCVLIMLRALVPAADSQEQTQTQNVAKRARAHEMMSHCTTTAGDRTGRRVPVFYILCDRTWH